jgi:Mor family transcriptional regulator
MNERNQLIYADYFGGMSLQDVAGKYGVTRQRIQQIVSKTGPKRPRLSGGSKLRKFSYEAIASYYKLNTPTLVDAAKNFGCSVSTITHALAEQGVVGQRKIRFTDESITDIVSRYQAGEKLRLIGETYQTSAQYINTILRRSGATARRRVKNV